MNPSIRYKVFNLEASKLDFNGVFKVYYFIEVFDEDYSIRKNFTKIFYPDKNNENYIPLEDLKEKDVLSWVKNSTDKEIIEQELIKEFNVAKEGVAVVKMPWSE